MRPMLSRLFRFAFRYGLYASVLLGGALTLLQMLGIILAEPQLVTGAREWLLMPAVGAAAMFGLSSFLLIYIDNTKPAD